METDFLTIDDLTKMLNVGKGFVYEHTRRGTSDPLPSFRFGKHLRFRREDVAKWIEQHRN
jgi:excisionase family DNA binding protein